jgi:sodium-dependent phosphate transporter
MVLITAALTPCSNNTVCPVIAIWLTYAEGSVDQKSETPLYLLFYGGVGIAVGLLVCGQRVMKTIGDDLTTITSSK